MMHRFFFRETASDRQKIKNLQHWENMKLKKLFIFRKKFLTYFYFIPLVCRIILGESAVTCHMGKGAVIKNEAEGGGRDFKICCKII